VRLQNDEPAAAQKRSEGALRGWAIGCSSEKARFGAGFFLMRATQRINWHMRAAPECILQNLGWHLRLL
jgi:hypothetical protein